VWEDGPLWGLAHGGHLSESGRVAQRQRGGKRDVLKAGGFLRPLLFFILTP